MKWPWSARDSADLISVRENLERSTRLWMRAYPRRWRVTFGDDLVGVLEELTPPGVRRVPIREAAEIVRAGWALRLRERPSVWKWLGYRFLDRELPEQYRFWIIDDLLGPLSGLRVAVVNQMIVLPMFVFYWVLLPESFSGPVPVPFVVFYLATLAIVIFSGRKYQARKRWRRFIGTEPPLELQSRRYRNRHVGA